MERVLGWLCDSQSYRESGSILPPPSHIFMNPKKCENVAVARSYFVILGYSYIIIIIYIEVWGEFLLRYLATSESQ